MEVNSITKSTLVAEYNGNTFEMHMPQEFNLSDGFDVSLEFARIFLSNMHKKVGDIQQAKPDEEVLVAEEVPEDVKED